MQDQTNTIGLVRNRNLVLAGAELLTHLAFDTSVLRKMHISALDELSLIFNFLSECCQGPCHENQELLVNTNIADTVETALAYAHSQVHSAGAIFAAGGGHGLGRERRREINDLLSQVFSRKRKDSVKLLCLAAATCMNSMLEGREESSGDIVHDYFINKLNPVVLLRSVTGAYVNYRVHNSSLSTSYIMRLPLVGFLVELLRQVRSHVLAILLSVSPAY